MNPAELVGLIRAASPPVEPQVKLGTVAAGYTSGLPTVAFDDEVTASPRGRPHLSSYTPVASDRVLLVRVGTVGSSWVVVGKIVAT